MKKWRRVLILRLKFDSFFPRLKEYPAILNKQVKSLLQTKFDFDLALRLHNDG